MIYLRFHPIEDAPQRFQRHLRLSTEQPEQVQTIELDAELRLRWDQPFSNDLNEYSEAKLVALGRRLFHLAFGATSPADLQRLRAAGQATLQIEERADSARANALPWELMHDGDGFLSHHPRTAIHRCPAGLTAPVPGVVG